MPQIHVDVTEIAAIWMGGVLLLIPLLGLAARLGAVPLLDALARLRAASAAGRSTEEVEARLARVEERLERLARAVETTGAGRHAA